MVSAPAPPFALHVAREQAAPVVLVERLFFGPRLEAGLQSAQAPEV